MTDTTDPAGGYLLAENLAEDDVIEIASNHYKITSKTTNAFKEITLWLVLISDDAASSSASPQKKATLTIDPKTTIQLCK